MHKPPRGTLRGPLRRGILPGSSSSAQPPNISKGPNLYPNGVKGSLEGSAVQSLELRSVDVSKAYMQAFDGKPYDCNARPCQ